MVEKAFINIDNYLKFFKPVDQMHQAGQDTRHNALEEITAQFGYLLEEDESGIPLDDEKDTVQESEQFLVPKTKFKKKSARKHPKSLSATFTIEKKNKRESNTNEEFRKSSRIKSNETAQLSPPKQNAFDEVPAQLDYLLENDEDTILHNVAKSKVTESEQFLLPNVPKPKEQLKSKQELSRVLLNPSSAPFTIESNNEAVIKNDKFRRSSRIASKKTAPMISSVLVPNQDEIRLATQSTKQNCYHDTTNRDLNTDSDFESWARVTTPVAQSSMIVPSIADENNLVKCIASKVVTPPNTEMITNSSSSVMKRIQEYEKRDGLSVLLPHQLSLKTPVQMDQKRNDEPCADDAPIAKTRLLRINVLKKKNTNVELNEIDKANKPVETKKNVIGNNIKLGAQNFKYYKSKKCPNADDSAVIEPKVNTPFDQKKKLVKFGHNSKALKMSAVVQKQLLPETERHAEKKACENDSDIIMEYPIKHVLEDFSSEDEATPKSAIPKWASKAEREWPLKVQAFINKSETIHLWFHNENLKNPKLNELFSTKVKMRLRTSSAVWNTRSQ